MTYDEFIEYIKDRANKELYYDHYDFYPEGYRANDPAISEMIKNAIQCIVIRTQTVLFQIF